MNFIKALFFAMALIYIAGCSPEVGSEAWCKDMKEKPKGDWSVNDTAEFAKSCVFKAD